MSSDWPARAQLFLDAQQHETAGFDTALAELRAGRKIGHWVWYVFPQIAGLSRSEVARRFALSGHKEATQYLRHPVLGARLSEALTVVSERLNAPEPRSVLQLMGGQSDAQKLVSCCTLFQYAAIWSQRNPDAGVAKRATEMTMVCRDILREAERQGLPPDFFTLDAMPDFPDTPDPPKEPLPDPIVDLGALFPGPPPRREDLVHGLANRSFFEARKITREADLLREQDWTERLGTLPPELDYTSHREARGKKKVRGQK